MQSLKVKLVIAIKHRYIGTVILSVFFPLVSKYEIPDDGTILMVCDKFPWNRETQELLYSFLTRMEPEQYRFLLDRTDDTSGMQSGISGEWVSNPWEGLFSLEEK